MFHFTVHCGTHQIIFQSWSRFRISLRLTDRKYLDFVRFKTTVISVLLTLIFHRTFWFWKFIGYQDNISYLIFSFLKVPKMFQTLWHRHFMPGTWRHGKSYNSINTCYNWTHHILQALLHWMVSWEIKVMFNSWHGYRTLLGYLTCKLQCILY